MKDDLTVKEILRTMLARDADYRPEGLHFHESWTPWFVEQESYVFIYTPRHDATGAFAMNPIRSRIVPKLDKEMLLELNSDDLSDERRYEIYQEVFGPFTQIDKWNYRTKFKVFIGTPREFVSHVMQSFREDELSTIVSQFITEEIRERVTWDL